MTLAGQLTNSSHVGFASKETVTTGATSVMRQVASRGISPSFFEHVRGLANQPLGEASRQLNQAYCDALSDPLLNATQTVIGKQTAEFAASPTLAVPLEALKPL